MHLAVNDPKYLAYARQASTSPPPPSSPHPPPPVPLQAPSPLGKQTRAGGMTKSVSTSGLSSLAAGGGGGGAMAGGAMAGGGVSSGLATEGRRQGMVGAHSSSVFGQADKTRDAVRDKLRPLFNNVRVSELHSSLGLLIFPKQSIKHSIYSGVQ